MRKSQEHSRSSPFRKIDAFLLLLAVVGINFVMATGLGMLRVYYFPMFKAAPTSISIPVEEEIVDIYAYPKSALLYPLFNDATSGQGYDAIDIEGGRIVGETLSPGAMNVALKVAGENGYRAFILSQEWGTGSVHLVPVDAHPLSRIEFLALQIILHLGITLLIAWSVWWISGQLVESRRVRLAAVIAVVVQPILSFTIVLRLAL